MEPKIVYLPAFTVVGMHYRGTNQEDEIPQMWGQFVPRIGEIQYRADNGATYGVMYGYDEASGAFDYVASLQVTQAANLPPQMVAVELPAAQYAAVDCTLPIVGQTYRELQAWIAASEHARAGTPDFELYPPSFNPGDPGSIMSIYIPIE